MKGELTRKEKLDLQAAVNEQVEPSVTIVAAETAGTCELCGAHEETRPYGPNGEEICHPCGQKDPIGTEQRMAKVMFGDDLTRDQVEQQLNSPIRREAERRVDAMLAEARRFFGKE